MNIRTLEYLGLMLALLAIGCAERRIATFVARYGCSPDQIEIVKTADGIHHVSGCERAGQLECVAASWTTMSCRPSQADLPGALPRRVRETHARQCAELALAGHRLPVPSSADLERTYRRP